MGGCRGVATVCSRWACLQSKVNIIEDINHVSLDLHNSKWYTAYTHFTPPYSYSTLFYFSISNLYLTKKDVWLRTLGCGLPVIYKAEIHTILIPTLAYVPWQRIPFSSEFLHSLQSTSSLNMQCVLFTVIQQSDLRKFCRFTIIVDQTACQKEKKRVLFTRNLSDLQTRQNESKSRTPFYSGMYI